MRSDTAFKSERKRESKTISSFILLNPVTKFSLDLDFYFTSLQLVLSAGWRP